MSLANDHWSHGQFSPFTIRLLSPQEEIFIKKKKKFEFYLFQPFSVPRTFSILEFNTQFPTCSRSGMRWCTVWLRQDMPIPARGCWVGSDSSAPTSLATGLTLRAHCGCFHVALGGGKKAWGKARLLNSSYRFGNFKNSYKAGHPHLL